MRRDPPAPEMNVTPLVDVVLVLLIIFMVIAPQMEAGARVELPGIANADPKTGNKISPLTVTLGRDGKIYYERAETTRQQLEPLLVQAHQEDQRRRVVLKGDRQARYADIRELFKLCRDIGFPGVSLQVGDRPDEESSGG